MEKCVAWARLAILAAAPVLLAAAAPRLAAVPARDLYERMVGLWVDAYRCNRNEIAASVEKEHDRLRERLDKVMPWLKSSVGAEELDRIETDFHHEMEGVYFTGCPPDYDGMRARSDYAAIIAEFERRARRSSRRGH